MTKQEYDVCIIGAGPGGYVAAIRASQLGLKAAVIEKDKPGGVCLNIGCIPSKALIHQAAIFQSAKGLADMGVNVDLKGFDYKKVYDKSRNAADKLSRGVRFLLDKNKVALIQGEAVKVQPGEITLQDGSVVTGKNIIIATGSRPREIPGFAFNDTVILSSTGALMLEKLPKSLLILGSGAIGVEFAHIMNAFGVDVHLVEMLDRILPLEDDEVVAVLQKSFKKRGIKTYTSTKAVSQQSSDGMIRVTLEDKEGRQTTVDVEKVLVSAGRVPNTSDLGLDQAGIEVDKGGFITVGDYCQTSVPGIYAIGDVVRTPLLAHVASKEGEIAAQHIAGLTHEPRLDPLSIPAATYCEPQVASFGYTERQAAEKDLPYKKAMFPYRGAGKAVATEQPEGIVKVLLDPSTGEIIGGHIVGAEATELIHELLLARKSELLPEDIATMIHAHPTLSETLMEAMREADGHAIQI
ncbi:MAG: dihydrolipoyl dehydrogenase [Bacillota bacterium]|nr:dihydrolipoyl dehydrogenase [Bacillota bacterium]